MEKKGDDLKDTRREQLFHKVLDSGGERKRKTEHGQGRNHVI